MVPGEGSCPAEKIKEHLVNKLESFGINYKTDTIINTLDACSLNKKLGDLMKKLIQLCLAHGVQLGIIKTVYKNKKKEKTSLDEVEDQPVLDEQNLVENEMEDQTSDSEDEMSDVEAEANDSGEEMDESDLEVGDESDLEVGDEQGLYQEAPEDVLVMNEDYGKVIDKLRKVISRYAGRSTPRKDSLQKAIKEWQKEKVKKYYCYLLSARHCLADNMYLNLC